MKTLISGLRTSGHTIAVQEDKASDIQALSDCRLYYWTSLIQS